MKELTSQHNKDKHDSRDICGISAENSCVKIVTAVLVSTRLTFFRKALFTTSFYNKAFESTLYQNRVIFLNFYFPWAFILFWTDSKYPGNGPSAAVIIICKKEFAFELESCLKFDDDIDVIFSIKWIQENLIRDLLFWQEGKDK